MPDQVRHDRQATFSRYARHSITVTTAKVEIQACLHPLAFDSMTEKGELEVASLGTTQGCPLHSALCAVDVLVYRVHFEKLSAHGDVRRPQIPNVAVQPIDVLGKVQTLYTLTI